MDHRAGVMLGDLDGGVCGRGGGPANEQGHGQAGALHFLGDVDHFIERGGDEAREADDIGAEFTRFFENFVARHHHAEVGDLVAIAGEHDADDVFADVMDIALDRGDEEAAGGAAAHGALQRVLGGKCRVFGADGGEVGVEEPGLFRFHERGEPSHRFFHYAGGFDHLRQEHLAGAEEIADHTHAIHQRPFNDLERAAVLQSGRFGVLIDEAVDALEQGVFQAFFHRVVAPPQVFLEFFAAVALEAFGQFEQAFGGVGAAVEQHVFDAVEEFLGNLIIDFQHAGVDDAHIHPGLGGMIEKRRVHRLAHRVVAPEREGNVRNTAGHLGPRQIVFDPARGVDEIQRVVVVLLDAGGDG